MTRAEIYERLNAVFQDVFDDPKLTVNDEITLLAAVEDEFGIEFSMGQTVSMKNVGEMVDYIQEEA